MISKEKRLLPDELEAVSLFINQRYGLEFRHQRRELLQDAVQSRIELSQAATGSQYVKLLGQSEDEVLLLINLLTVHETYFFREPSHLEIMAEQVIPRLVSQGGSKPFIRLLSAGCSTGEEAYSMAIAALKIPGAGSRWDFEVIGVDVDKEAINKANTGVYGLYSFRSCPADIQNDYFEPAGKDRFRVKRFVKEKVRFEPLNLFEQVYPEWLGDTDIIFYRNVSIYFSQAQRKEVFRRLAGLLKACGCLFLSCTETLYHNNNLMSLVKSGEAFYYQKQGDHLQAGSVQSRGAAAPIKGNTVMELPCAPRFRPAVTAKKRLMPIAPATGRGGADGGRRPEPSDNKADMCRQMFAEALELVKGKQEKEAIARLERLLAIDSFFVAAYTLKANILLNRQSVAAATEACRAALAIDSLCLEAYLLLGMAAKLAGKTGEAIQRFKEAVYVSHECWLAHFFLAEMYQLQAEISFARREFEVAMRILKQGNFASHGLSFFLVPFQMEDFIQLCQHNLANLQE